MPLFRSAGPLLGIFTIGVLIPWINGTGAIVGGATSLCFMAWLCFRAQTAIVTGEMSFAAKPTFTNGCDYSFMPGDPLNMLAINQTVAPMIDESVAADDSPEFAIHRISYIWYTLLGALITIGVATIISTVSGFNDPREMNSKLFAPFVRKCLRLNSEKREEPVGIETEVKHDCCVDLKAIP